MKNRKLVYSLILGILIAGCGALPAVQASPPPAQVIVVTATFVPDAGAPAATNPPLSQQQPLPQPQASLIVPATFPAPLINTSGLPLASPNDGTLNCRGGPDIRWPVADTLEMGEIVPVTGRNTDNSWWYVTNPAAPMGSCWISAEFTTITGDVSGVPIQVVTEPIPANGGVPYGTINFVLITLEPDTIDLPGCTGPTVPIHISAKIGVDGPVSFRFHFEGEEIGRLRIHDWGFDRADIADAFDSFTPPAHEGKHLIFLVVDTIDLQGLNAAATYTITCS